MIVPVYATVRDLDDLGINPEAFVNAGTTDFHKRKGLKAASGRIAPYLRKRYSTLLTVITDDLDLSGIAGGGTATASGIPSKSQDITIMIVTGGTVGVPGITYAVTIDGTAGATTNLPIDGKVVIDNVTIALAGTFAADEVIAYTTGVDWGVREVTATVAAYILLYNRGLDPATEQDLKSRFDAAMAWAKDLSKGDGDLSPDEDVTPQTAEAGPRFMGQRTPWQFLGLGSYNRGSGSL